MFLPKDVLKGIKLIYLELHGLEFVVSGLFSQFLGLVGNVSKSFGGSIENDWSNKS